MNGFDLYQKLSIAVLRKKFRLISMVADGDNNNNSYLIIVNKNSNSAQCLASMIQYCVRKNSTRVYADSKQGIIKCEKNGNISNVSSYVCNSKKLLS